MKKKHKQPWSIFISILLAILFGLWIGPQKDSLDIPFYLIFDVLGKMFLNALTLVVVPLVSSSIISGIARIGSDNDFRRLGGKTFAFYFGTSLLAIFIGLFLVDVIQPGFNQEFLFDTSSKTQQITQLAIEKENPIVEILLKLIPSNIIYAFSKGQMLGLIFFCFLFGYAISKIETGPSQIMQSFFQGVFQAMIRITHLIMKFLPIGVFCLVAKVFMSTGAQSLSSVAMFTATVIIAIAIFMFIGLPLLLRFIGNVSPLRHFKAMGPALITAFSTSSSSASLPITIECVEKRAGVSNRICSLVVPLGTSVNMAGSALYICCSAMFIAQVYHIQLSITMQLLIVFLSLIASIGVAGVPSASLVGILVVLRSVGLPSEGLALLLAVDRILDMCRATANVLSDSVCAVLVAKTEGEKNVLAKDPSEMPIE